MKFIIASLIGYIIYGIIIFSFYYLNENPILIEKIIITIIACLATLFVSKYFYNKFDK